MLLKAAWWWELIHDDGPNDDSFDNYRDLFVNYYLSPYYYLLFYWHGVHRKSSSQMHLMLFVNLHVHLVYYNIVILYYIIRVCSVWKKRVHVHILWTSLAIIKSNRTWTNSYFLITQPILSSFKQCILY